MGGMEGIKGERNEQQSDRAKNHDQNEPYLGRFEVEKVNFFDVECFVYIFRIVLPTEAGSTFSEISLKHVVR